MEVTERIIAHYFYTYGAGQDLNRRVEFFRKKEDDPTTLTARFKGDLKGTWKVTTELQAPHIEVEMENTTQKMRNLMAAKEKGFTTTVQKKTIDQIEPKTQDAILQSLVPRGSRKLEIENDVGGLNGFERVKAITIFDPT